MTEPVDDRSDGLGRGERGSAMVLALVLLFSFTAGAVVVLARDYDDRIADRSVAQAIAFQSARAGAQQVALGSLREDGAVVIDEARATEQAAATARRLLAQYGKEGSAVVAVAGDRVTVTVTIIDVIERGFTGTETAEITARGSARAESG